MVAQLWTPPEDVRESTRIGHYLQWLQQHRGLEFESYDDLWLWSVEELEAFWSSLWEYFDLRSPYDAVLQDRSMPGAVWFPGAKLNYAAQVLAAADAGGPERPVVVARSQTRASQTLTASQLREQVARARAGLIKLGVAKGDRVVGYIPNVPEAIVVFLATASLGAIWSSCSPEFGTRSVIDRFQQIEPKVLIAVDGYRYGDTAMDRTAEVAELRRGLETVKSTVILPYLGTAAAGDLTWDQLLHETAPLDFVEVPFDHPLYVLYSSGTTGRPKAIVHGHGGILIEHLKALALHSDLGATDRFFAMTTTGWMTWNYLISGLLVGASIVTFDGNPNHPDLMNVWRMVEETGATYFMAGAPWIMNARKAGVHPAELGLRNLRGIASVGAHLPAEGFEWIHEEFGGRVVLGSTSGGTDVCTAFVGSCPMVPVYSGEISCRFLGAKVEAFDPDGKPVVGQLGELVLSEPLPSMPVGFWGDPHGKRYRAAYFEDYPGVWRHGDWILITERGSCVIAGRSDATLNRGGVRLGTGEFYAAVEDLPEVVDSLVVHLEDHEGGSGRLLLFIVPAAGVELDETLRVRIAGALRSTLSPRHVPDEIHAVPSIPRTLTGKKLEVPVKRVLGGAAADAVASLDALSDPESLRPFEALAPHLVPSTTNRQ